MARDRSLQTTRKIKIVQFYKRLDAAVEFGAKKYTTAYCVAATAHQFDLRPRTVENYVYG